MTLNVMNVVYYSPTRTSQKVARAIAEGLGIARRLETDLTTDFRTDPIMVKDSICIVAAPVYGGLVAPAALERISRLRGENSVAIPVVVYGNRDYEDALVQLRDRLQELGFTPICGAAFIGEHSYSRPEMPVAAGRPDQEDLEKARIFGRQAFNKLCDMVCPGQHPDVLSKDFKLEYSQPLAELIQTPAMKGHVPYKEPKASAPMAPEVNDLCYGCGDCVSFCPTEAIEIKDGISTTDANRCSKCCACVKFCPVGARTFDTPFTAYLYQNFSARREPECFI